MLKEAKYAGKFFKCIGNVHDPENVEASAGCKSIYRPLSEEDYEAVSVSDFDYLLSF